MTVTEIPVASVEVSLEVVLGRYKMAVIRADVTFEPFRCEYNLDFSSALAFGTGKWQVASAEVPPVPVHGSYKTAVTLADVTLGHVLRDYNRQLVPDVSFGSGPYGRDL